MRERAIEQFLRKGIESLGGMCWKLTSPANRGVPDRLVIYMGQVIFVEVKSPIGRLSPLQVKTGQDLQRHGAQWRVIRSYEDVEVLLNELHG